jgi:anti-anti-sigma regulatory factor
VSVAIAEDLRAPASGGPGTPLAAQVTHEGGQVVVRLRGALSGPRVPLLESVLYRLETRGRGRLTLDLRDLDAIDAAGAAMVHRSVERALHAGRSISVLGAGLATRHGASIPIAEAT